jgi:hypothetical protein
MVSLLFRQALPLMVDVIRKYYFRSPSPFDLVYRPAFDDTGLPGIGFTYQSQGLAESTAADSLAREGRVIARRQVSHPP